MKLTNTSIKNAKPREKSYRLFDGGGLYLEVAPKGGKWWRLKYRFAGKEKRLSLGTYPDVSLKAARERRDEARKRIREGMDPSEHRKAQKADVAEHGGNTFEVVARQWFAKASERWVPSHAQRNLRRLERDVFPALHARPIREVTAPELLRVIERIDERGVRETARRVLQICRQVFEFAVITGKAEGNPALNLRSAIPPSQPKHFAALTEPGNVGDLLKNLHGYKGGMIVGSALKLAPLVFVRPGELRRARWADIDLKSAEWRYVVTKTRTEHIVPLAKQAVEILRELHPLTGCGEYVFPSARSPKRAMSDNAVLAAMRTMGIPKDEMTGHGFRAMARTMLDEQIHVPVHLIEHQLAHSVRDPLGRAYNRTAHLPERREMMQKWANYLDGLRLGSNVIQFPASKGAA